MPIKICLDNKYELLKTSAKVKTEKLEKHKNMKKH